MIKDLRVAAIQAKVPKFRSEGEKQIRRLVEETLKKPVDMIAPGTIGPNATDFPSFGHALIICPNRMVLDVKNLNEIRNTYGSKWQPKDIPQIKLKIK